MTQSTPNEGILKVEGLLRPAQYEPGPLTNYYFRDPHHKDFERPIVDTSAPFNPLDESHLARTFGSASGFMQMATITPFLGAKEEAPYLTSYSSVEWLRIVVVACNLMWVNFVIMKYVAGSINFLNCRIRWATMLHWALGHARVTAAAAVAGAYYPLYEALYTYVEPFRIRDPTYNGWRQGWLEGQSTYGARFVAAVCPALGLALYHRSSRRFAFNFLGFATMSLYYELARINVFPGLRFTLLQFGFRESDRAARYGTLSPEMYRPIDHDTGKSVQASQHRYFRMAMGLLQDTIWENGAPEYLPLFRRGMKFPNPYYMWQKAPQGRSEQPVRYKNDLWSLPAMQV